jgi:hypothetical protein
MSKLSNKSMNWLGVIAMCIALALASTNFVFSKYIEQGTIVVTSGPNHSEMMEARLFEDVTECSVALLVVDGVAVSKSSGTTVFCEKNERGNYSVIVICAAHSLSETMAGVIVRFPIFNDEQVVVGEYASNGRLLDVDKKADVALLSAETVHEARVAKLILPETRVGVGDRVAMAGWGESGKLPITRMGRITAKSGITSRYNIISDGRVTTDITMIPGDSGTGVFVWDKKKWRLLSISQEIYLSSTYGPVFGMSVMINPTMVQDIVLKD